MEFPAERAKDVEAGTGGLSGAASSANEMCPYDAMDDLGEIDDDMGAGARSSESGGLLAAGGAGEEEYVGQ